MMVSREKKSVASSPAAWADRKVRQLVSGRRGAGAEVGGGQDSADGARAQVLSQPGEFALDASVSPGWILLRQTHHEVTDLVTDR